MQKNLVAMNRKRNNSVICFGYSYCKFWAVISISVNQLLVLNAHVCTWTVHWTVWHHPQNDVIFFLKIYGYVLWTGCPLMTFLKKINFLLSENVSSYVISMIKPLLLTFDLIFEGQDLILRVIFYVVSPPTCIFCAFWHQDHPHTIFCCWDIIVL